MNLNSIERLHVGSVIWFPIFKKKDNGQCTWKRGQILECHLFPDHVLVSFLHEKKKPSTTAYICPASAICTDTNSPTFCVLKNSYEDFLHQIVCRQGYSKISLPLEVFEKNESMSHFFLSDQGNMHDWRVLLVYATLLFHSLIKKKSWLLCQKMSSNCFFNFNTWSYCYVPQRLSSLYVYSSFLDQFGFGFQRMFQSFSKALCHQKNIALILLGHSVSCTTYVALQLIKKFTIPPMASVLSEPFCMAYILSIFTQREGPSGYQSLAGFHYRLFFHSKATQPIHCCVSLWCGPLLLGLKKTSNNYACPLIFIILCTVILKDKQHPESCIMSPTLQEDAEWILQNLYSAQNKNIEYLSYYQNINDAFAYCTFPFSFINQVWKLIFVIAFLETGHIYFSNSQHENVRTSFLTFENFLQRMLFYLDIPLVQDRLEIMFISDLHCLCQLSNTLYHCLLKSLISAFNSHAPQNTEQQHTWCVDIVYGVGETLDNMQLTKPVSKRKSKMPNEVFPLETDLEYKLSVTDHPLDEFFVRCCQDVLNSSYIYDAVLKDVSMHKKHMKRLIRKDINLFSNEIVVWKCLKLSHEYLHSKNNHDQHTDDGKNRNSLSRQKKLINKTNKKSEQLFTNLLKEFSENQKCISFNPQKPSCFEFSHYLSQATYDTHEFYLNNTMHKLPNFLWQLLEESTASFLKEFLTTYRLSLMTYLRSVQCEEAIKSIYHTINTVQNRFYLLNFSHQPLHIYSQNHVPYNNNVLRSGDVQHVAYQLYYYRFAQTIRSQDYYFINAKKLLKRLECFVWMLKEDEYSTSFSETKKIHLLLQVLGVSFFPYTWCSTIICLHRSTFDFINARVKHFHTRLLPACIRLQRYCISFLYRCRKKKECRAIIHLQASIRAIQIKKELQKTFENTTEYLMWGLVVFLCRTCYVHNTSYVEINEFASKQILLEKSLCRRRLDATVRIQKWWRGLLAMKHFKQKEKEAYTAVAALIIQSVCRRYLAQLHLCTQLEQKKLNDAAVIIQKNFRCWWNRKKYLQLTQLRVAIVPIKRITSSFLITKHRFQMLPYLRHHRSQRTNLLQSTLHLNLSAICIQRSWKGYIVRKQYCFLLRLAQFCQTIALTNLHKAMYDRILYKIIFLQKWWKSYLQLRPFGLLFLSNTRRQNVNSLKNKTVTLSSVRNKESFAYRQEIISFNLLHIPLLILQAVYCHSFHSFANDSNIMPLQFTSKQINPNPWAWLFLRLLKHYAQKSWNIAVETEPEASGLSWYHLKENHFSLAFFKANKSLFLESWATISLLTQMPQLVWIQSISIGGQHTLLVLGSLQKNSSDSSTQPTSYNFSKHKKCKSYDIVYSVYAWGLNDRGQLGRFETIEPKKNNIFVKDILQPLSFSLTTYKKSSSVESKQTCFIKPYSINHSTSIQLIGTGNEFSIALAFDGTMYTWGDNTYGQTGQGFRYHYIDKPTVLTCFETSRIVSFSNSPYHVMCLTQEGSTYTWGKRTYIGLEDLLLEGDIYTPWALVWKDSKIIPCDRTLCGYGFNILCPMHSTTLLYIWGRNDSGQLGLGAAAPFFSHTIQEIQCEIPFSVPKHYVSLRKVCCGSNFVVATVHSSTFPLFLWGAFKVFDPVETDVKKNFSRAFFPLTQKKTSSNETNTHPIDQSFKIRSIMKPTPVLSEFWENSCIDDVTCGHCSFVQVAFFSNNCVYGFNFLQPHWYHKVALEQKQEPSSYSYYRPLEKKKEPKPSIYPTKLEGEFHLIPALYQYKKWRNGIHPLRTLHTTYNSRGFQLDYAVCSKTNLKDIFRRYKVSLQSNAKKISSEPFSNPFTTQSSKAMFSNKLQIYFTPQKTTDQKFLNDKNAKKSVSETDETDYDGVDTPLDIQKSFPFHLSSTQQKQAILLGEMFLGPFTRF